MADWKSLINMGKGALSSAGLIEEDESSSTQEASSGQLLPKTPLPSIPSQPASMTTTPTPASSTPGASDSEFYAKLKEHTPNTVSPVLAKLESAMKPLRAVISDRTTLVRAAVASAGQDLSPSAIVAGFSVVRSLLAREGNDFRGHLEDMKQAAQQKKQRIEEINQQVTELQKEQVILSSGVAGTEAKIQQAKANFDTAYQRRSDEIDNEQKEYASILGVPVPDRLVSTAGGGHDAR